MKEKPEDEQTYNVPEHVRASEYLANERTFLAWIRTSIAVISIGFLITRVDPFAYGAKSERLAHVRHTSFVMGLAMMGVGALIAGLALWRFHIINRAIAKGAVKADVGLVVLITILVILLSASMIVFMLLVE